MQMAPSKDIPGTQIAQIRAFFPIFFCYFLQILKPRATTCDARSRPPPLSFTLRDGTAHPLDIDHTC